MKDIEQDCVKIKNCKISDGNFFPIYQFLFNNIEDPF